MDFVEAISIAAAGVAAGAINTVVGSGSLVTFPVLLAFGYSPVVANVTNTVGLVPGSVTGAVGYRRELAGQGQRVRRMGLASLVGAIVGAALLLVLPAAAFKAIVPVIIGLAIVLVLLQPRLNRMLEQRRAPSSEGGWVVTLAVFATGIYGGYFSAAQGILLLAVLGLGLPETLQRVNGLKNVLQLIVNVVAAAVFAVVAHVAWAPAGLMAIGALIGGLLGAHYGRRLSPTVLRAIIVVIGVVAIFMLV
ncbi:MAG: sulfite exporter TauE/SafE family protein [Intrasporangium sp.]|uniref:sulfite exporter TauE/SafE family protein n=1 Tax=Intrasporangium sp. TaxID=1925024 RepID=UPI00264852A8|nr:sulfite exporter TauE/SafE family protein [Intrasporangium sp.]MDN5796463.1 sulfite exporter TauE/SafE family protein [Intrasporangium sp.]